MFTPLICDVPKIELYHNHGSMSVLFVVVIIEVCVIVGVYDRGISGFLMSAPGVCGINRRPAGV